MDDCAFVDRFRASAPYLHAFRGQTFVIAFGGEVVAGPSFIHLAHDIALLASLGIRIVLVHGTRPQIEERLRARGARSTFHRGHRITDDAALACVKEAAGTVSVEISALLSMSLANTPMAGARIRVTSGNFVTARPLGIVDGVDHRFTGAVRRIDGAGIRQALDAGTIVLLSPIGYAPTGDLFNLGVLEVAAEAATAVEAGKFIALVGARGLADADGQILRELTPAEAEVAAERLAPPPELADAVRHAVQACRAGVRRAHLIDQRRDGALLLELFTRDGIGTMVNADRYQETRKARIEDVVGILQLIAPLEAGGLLIPRSREHLELDIGRFTVVERDGTIIACAALYPFPDEGTGELACVAVHPDYRHLGYGDALLRRIRREAEGMGLARLVALTTRAAHWFRERGFVEARRADLPAARQAAYDEQRNSQVFIRSLG